MRCRTQIHTGDDVPSSPLLGVEYKVDSGVKRMKYIERFEMDELRQI